MPHLCFEAIHNLQKRKNRDFEAYGWPFFVFEAYGWPFFVFDTTFSFWGHPQASKTQKPGSRDCSGGSVSV